MQLYLPVLALSLTLSTSIVQSNEPGEDLDIFIQQDDAEQIKDTLERRGWEVREGNEGELLLFPATPSESNDDDSLALSEPDSATDAINLNALETELQPHGWKTQRDSEGNLLLYPPEPQGDSTASLATTASDENVSENLDQLDDLLQQRGWTTQRDEDGSLLLFPATHSASTSGFTVTTLEHCQFGSLTLASETAVTLPVNDWSEAHALAVAWLEQQPETDLQVGKIRQVNRIYVVSMVDKAAPHALSRQLVINSSDGRVIALP